MNPGGVRRVAFMRSFRVISQAGAKDTVAKILTSAPSDLVEGRDDERIMLVTLRQQEALQKTTDTWNDPSC